MTRPSRSNLLRTLTYVLCGLGLTAVSFRLGDFALDTLSQILIFAIAAVGLDLALGYSGLPSFAQGAFFGLGAYATVLFVVKFGISPWPALALAALFVGAVGCAAGAAFVRVNGVSFFIVTLVFSQLLASLAIRWRALTGGSDGVGGLERPYFLGLDLFHPQNMFLLALMSAAFILLVSEWLVRAPFGATMSGVRENEARMAALGYDVLQVRLLAFTLSAMIGGYAGGLYAFFNGFVSPDLLSWQTSGAFLLMVVLGGRGTLFGPILGAAGYLWAKDYASSHFAHWLLIVGLLFVLSVLYFPGGLGGLRRSVEARH